MNINPLCFVILIFPKIIHGHGRDHGWNFLTSTKLLRTIQSITVGYGPRPQSPVKISSAKQITVLGHIKFQKVLLIFFFFFEIFLIFNLGQKYCEIHWLLKEKKIQKFIKASPKSHSRFASQTPPPPSGDFPKNNEGEPLFSPKKF